MAEEGNNTEPESLESLEMMKKRLEVAKLERESEKLSKEMEKIDTEREKIEAEKKNLIKPFYKQTAAWDVLVKLLIGLSGFFLAFYTNLLGINDMRIEAKALRDSIRMADDTVLIKNALIKHSTDSLRKLEQKINLLNDQDALQKKEIIIGKKIKEQLNNKNILVQLDNLRIKWNMARDSVNNFLPELQYIRTHLPALGRDGDKKYLNAEMKIVELSRKSVSAKRDYDSLKNIVIKRGLIPMDNK